MCNVGDRHSFGVLFEYVFDDGEFFLVGFHSVIMDSSVFMHFVIDMH